MEIKELCWHANYILVKLIYHIEPFLLTFRSVSSSNRKWKCLHNFTFQGLLNIFKAKKLVYLCMYVYGYRKLSSIFKICKKNQFSLNFSSFHKISKFSKNSIFKKLYGKFLQFVLRHDLIHHQFSFSIRSLVELLFHFSLFYFLVFLSVGFLL